MIELKSVSKVYNGEAAVEDVSLKIEKGEFCVLIGTSGCGKSTTLKMINRIVEPSAGEIFIDDQPVTSFRPELLRRKIGYVIQNIGLFPHWTVKQNISVVPELLKFEAKQTLKRVKDLLDMFGLPPDKYLKKYPHQLSGGEAQRVGVARALAADPEFLLMDEPFGALDPITRENLQTEFAKIQKELKKTIVFVTHDMDEAIRLSSRIAVMNVGKIVQYATTEELLTQPANDFVKAFLGEDRGWKRLARCKVKDYLRPANRANSSTAAGGLVSREPTWLVDDIGRIMGAFLSPESKNMVPLDRDFPLTPELTLKDALSRMLWKGLKSVPVVNDSGHLVGEIRLNDIVSL